MTTQEKKLAKAYIKVRMKAKAANDNEGGDHQRAATRRWC